MACAIVTRDAEGVAPYVAVLASLGLDAIAMPVTRIELFDGVLRSALTGGPFTAIVCASPRVADALVAERSGRLPEVWALGFATARVLEDAGITAITDPAAKDARTLATAMLAHRSWDRERVLIPRAAEGRRELIDALADAGALVDTVDIYQTVSTPAGNPEIARGLALLPSASVVCLFAPSQVAALDQLVGILTLPCPLVAIGETTAAALREAGAGVVAVAATPTPDGLAKAVATVYPRSR